MKEIALTRGKVALVDDEDYERIAAFKWYAMNPNGGRNWYAVRIVNRKAVLMHRAVMRAADGDEVDHRNHNGLDNRRDNLRLCTSSQNKHNLRKRTATPTSSRYKGVSWSKHWQKWQCYINNSRKRRHLGWFDDEKEAALAYNRAARELFGEFAHVNEVAP